MGGNAALSRQIHPLQGKPAGADLPAAFQPLHRGRAAQKGSAQRSLRRDGISNTGRGIGITQSDAGHDAIGQQEAPRPFQ